MADLSTDDLQNGRPTEVRFQDCNMGEREMQGYADPVECSDTTAV